MSFRLQLWVPVALAALTPLFLLGCGGSGDKPTTEVKDKGHDHAHDHDHAHHGPHEGHLIELGEEEFHAEWTHDDATGKVTIYVLDGAIKKEVPIAAETVTIVVKNKADEKSYELTAVNRTTGDMPTARQFEIIDKELVGVLETIGGDISATLKIDVNGKKFDGKITLEEHKH